MVSSGGGGRVGVKFWTFARGGSYQNRASANKGEGGSKIVVILWERNKRMTPKVKIIIYNIQNIYSLIGQEEHNFGCNVLEVSILQ